MLLAISPIFAQKTAIYNTNNRFFREAIDLFEKEKYAAAHDRFHTYIKTTDDEHEELRIAAEFYSAVCSLYLFHKDAEYTLEQFVVDHPDTQWVLKVYYELATYNYKRKKYKKALEWFEYVDPRDLTNDQLTEFYFKRGHCYFQRDDYTNAKNDLREVVDVEGKYQTPATYYYSHIAYAEGNHQTALEGFEKLNADPNFSPVVPYYITQIYYNQGRYDELLTYAPPLLDSANQKTTKRLPEISRLIGDSYFRESQYQEALPYLEMYHEETPRKDRSRNDFYQMGFTYYNTSAFTQALGNFNECTDEDDELAQSAFYYMGDCYMKLDQKPYARTAFADASKMDHNLTLKEDALFNYAKLAFELSYNPFHEAIDAFEQYLEEYPGSERRDEAYEFLLNVYMKSRNYEAALRSLNRIENKDTRTMEAYQMVAYNRGVELFQAGDFDGAAEFFDKVSTYDVNQTLIAEATFWKAENAYRQKNYTGAFSLYQQFLSTPGSINSGWYEEANYGSGYALFKQKKYAEASAQFGKYVDNYKGDDPKRLSDARIRLGDCHYVKERYTQAIDQYDKAIYSGATAADYAMFQKAICQGFMEKHSSKITVLQKLLDDQPDSKYTVDAKFELGKTNLTIDNLAESNMWYNKVLNDHPLSVYRKYSLVDLLLIAVKQNATNKAKGLWSQVLSEYPNDPIRNDAYHIVEEILLDDPNFTPPEDIVPPSEHEASVFRKAEDYVLGGDCSNGISKLEDYLERYQPAAFGTEANYHLGNCYFEQGKVDNALNAFNFVISQPLSAYTEEALKIAATINYNRENYVQAKNHYTELQYVAQIKNNVLEAEIGLMRCHYWLNEFEYAIEFADKVILNDATPDEIRKTAYLWRGRIRMDQGKIDDAYYDFLEVEKSGGAEGAEAKYRMAEIAFAKEAYEPCEKELFELIQNYSGYNKWKYSGFLLLVDVYIGMEDYIQAEATLNTIQANVSEPWVIDSANEKAAKLEALQNGGTQRNQEEVEINLGGDDDDDEEENIDEE